MNTLLHVKGSPRNDDSRSAAIASAFLETVRRTAPSLIVDTIDVWRDALPEFDGPSVAWPQCL